MQVSRSQFQGHPFLGRVSLSLLAGLSLGIHGQSVLDWVHLIESNPQLLASIVHTQYSAKAITTLITMINALPEGSIVLEFILSNLNHTFKVCASAVGDVLHPNLQYRLPNLSTVPSTIVDTWSTAGVYLFQQIETGRSYIGASANIAIRLSGHLSQLSGNFPAFTFHTQVNAMGGFSSLSWSPIYSTFSFTMEFANLHPGVWLSQGELQILQAFTQFPSRLLEQSLINYFNPDFNSNKSVYFEFVNFNSLLLSVHDYSLSGAKPVDIFDFVTGEHIMRLASISAASILLYGVKDRRHVVRASLGALSGLKWTAPGATTPRVMVTSPGVPLTNIPVVHRLSSVKEILTLPGIELTDLVMPFIHVYDINFTLLGKYTSYGSAIIALSPIKTAGCTLKFSERYSRGLQRVCNFSKTTLTERGEVYVARHPWLVNRNPAT